MGELHLDIYVERMDREFDVKCVVGQPQVNYRETIKQKAEFNYLHKKQSGGSGQFARVVGYVEPIDEDEVDDSSKGAAKGDGFEFVNNIIGTNIPPEFISSCEKGARDAMAKGSLTGNPMTGVRVVVTDGQAHAVDSSDMAFRIAMAAAVREVTPKARGVVLEPIMALEVTSPEEFQGTLVSNLNRRMGVIQSSDVSESGTEVIIQADVPLNQMFGYSTDLRSSTQGKGEYSMEYKSHEPVAKQEQDELVAEFKARWAADTK
jgi:elongation factor G